MKPDSDTRAKIRIEMRMKAPDLMGSSAPLTNGSRQLWRALVNRMLQPRGGLVESFRATMAVPGRNGAGAVIRAIFPAVHLARPRGRSCSAAAVSGAWAVSWPDALSTAVQVQSRFLPKNTL